MIDELQKRAHEIFVSVLDEAPHARSRLVAHACAGDAGLRAAVERLLRAVDETSFFLEVPALGERSARREQPETLPPGAIPGYRILGVLGVGGMATVYEAEQLRPRRRVALKVMHRSLAHSTSIHRFHFEAEVLARLRHPGIAQVYEVGVFSDATGRSSPYFAMEFVEGARTLTDYARAAGLSLRDRLAMFAEVCDAVQHGHQLGVIHRDLKPSNILVDRNGAPKIIDFGVARSVLSDSERITTISDRGQILGTINSMSPEQCSGADRVDTRSDVYSLGVVLYELLTDRPPYDLAGKSIPEAIATIQSNNPQRAGAINPEARGDLEAIALMAMDREPKRRYQGADALAADVRRFLSYKTIQASLPTPWRRAALFAKRHKVLAGAVGVTAATLVVASALIGVFGYSSWRESIRRAEAERVALAERDTALRRSYAASVTGAFLAFRAGELTQAREHLELAPASHRGWEWDLVRAFAVTGETVVDAHQSQIAELALSARARRVITVSYDSTAAVWDADTGEPVTRAWFEAAPVSVAFAPDAPSGPGGPGAPGAPEASIAYIGLGSGALLEWKFDTSQPPRTIATHPSAVQSVAVRPDGAVALATMSGTVVVHDPATGSVLASLPSETRASMVRFTEDGERLVVGCSDGALRVLDAESLETIRTMQLGAQINAIAVRSGIVAAGGAEGYLGVWRLDTGDELLKDPGAVDISTIRSVSIRPDGSSVFVGRINRTLLEWRFEGVRYLFAGHDEAVTSLDFDEHANQLVSASWDSTLRLWRIDELRAPGPFANFARANDHLHTVDISPDGAALATAGRDGSVRVADTALGVTVATLHGHTNAVYAVRFSPDGRTLASAAADATVRLWSLATGDTTGVLEGPGALWTLAFSPSGDRIYAAGAGGVVASWEFPSLSPSLTYRAGDQRVIKIAVSPDGARLASCARDGTVALFDTASPEPVKVIQAHRSDAFAVIYSPDGRRLYTGSRDQTVRVWDATTGELIDTLPCRGHFVTSLAITPDGARLAAFSWYGEIMLWDLSTHDRVLSFAWDRLAIREALFSSRDPFLITVGHAGRVRRFDGAPHDRRFERFTAARDAWSDAKSRAERLGIGAGMSVDAVEAMLAREAPDPRDRAWLRLAVLHRAVPGSSD